MVGLVRIDERQGEENEADDREDDSELFVRREPSWPPLDADHCQHGNAGGAHGLDE